MSTATAIGVWCSIILLAFLCSPGTAQVDLRTCGDEDSVVTCSFFFGKVNEAFRQGNVLYTLRKAFFPSEGNTPPLFMVAMTLDVENVTRIACKDENYEFGNSSVDSPPSMDEVCSIYDCGPLTLGWRHQWSKTVISYIIKREDLDLLKNTSFNAFAAAAFSTFDAVIDHLGKLRVNGTTNISSLGATRDDTVQLHLIIPELPCRPDNGVLLDAWEDILPWLQLYAQNSDNLELEDVEYSHEDRGFAFREERGGNRSLLTLSLLTVMNVLMNIVFALAATYFLHKYHGYLGELQCGKKYQLVASMYWSVVFLCFTSAVVMIIGNCYLYYPLYTIDDETFTVFPFRITSDITVVVLAVAELVASLLTHHDVNFFIPYGVRIIQWCLRCRGSQNRLDTLNHITLGVGMWIIILFLQLVVSSIIPLAVVIIINPVPSLAFVAIMISLFFCLVVFVAYFLNAFEGNYILKHRFSQMEKRNSSAGIQLEIFNKEWSVKPRERVLLFVQAIAFFLIFVIFFVGVILYLIFVKVGGNTNTLSGVLVSFVPSVILAAITWAAKKHLFKELEEEEEEAEDKEEENGDRDGGKEKPRFQIGGFSFQPRRRRRSTSTKTKRKKTVTGDDHAPASVHPVDEEGSVSAENVVSHIPP